MRSKTVLRLFVSTLLAAVLGRLDVVSSACGQAAWDGGGSNDNWSTVANWRNDLAPVSGVSASVSFRGSTRTTPVQDIASPFDLAQLDFETGAASFDLSGNGLRFHGNSARIRNLASSAQTVRCNIEFVETLSVVSTTGGPVEVRATISGDGLLTTDGPSFVLFSQSNDYTGVTNVRGGTLRLGADGALPDGARLNVDRFGILDLNGYGVLVSDISGSGSIALGGSDFTISIADQESFSGAITGTGA
ncbi:MAG: hypothetical protein WD468_05650 [Pirellulales bacterium]